MQSYLCLGAEDRANPSPSTVAAVERNDAAAAAVAPVMEKRILDEREVRHKEPTRTLRR